MDMAGLPFHFPMPCRLGAAARGAGLGTVRAHSSFSLASGRSPVRNRDTARDCGVGCRDPWALWRGAMGLLHRRRRRGSAGPLVGLGYRAPSSRGYVRYFNAAAAGSSSQQVLDYDQAVESLRYWNDLINKIDRPTARMMLSKIDRENLTGVDTKLKGVSTSKNSLYQFLFDVKVNHPTKVVLVRVGEFYETWGFDAVLLVEHCGLNPMGYRLPRAGCPRVNIQRTLDDLTAKGLRCVVCEEAPMPYSYGARSKRKTRFVAQVVTPHSPVYVYNLSGNHALSPDFNFQAPPVVGIEQRKPDAFTVSLMDVDLRQVTTYYDVNEEIAAHIVSSQGFSPPVYCHESYLDRAGPDGSSGLQGQRVRSIIQDSQKVRVKGSPFSEKFVEIVRKDLDLGPDASFTQSSAGGGGESRRPLPLYSMTARSIGLADRASGSPSGTPSLVASLLPKGAPAPCKHFLTRYLMHPPPPGVAGSVQRSLRRIAGVSEPLPLLPLLPAHKIAKMIHSREANHSVYVDLLAMLRGVRSIFESKALEEALYPLTAVAALNTGRRFKTSEIRDACDDVIAEIEGVVNTAEYEELMGALAEDEGEGAGEEADDDAIAVAAAAGSRARPGDQALESLLRSNEKSARVVLGSCIAGELEMLDAARARVMAAVRDQLEPALKALSCPEEGWPGRSAPRISYDAVNNSVSVRGAQGAAKSRKGWADDFGLINPRDRNGSKLADRFSTEELEDALNDYRLRCHELDLAVKGALKALASRIQPFVTQVVYLSHLALVSKTFWLHATEAGRRGWSLPEIDSGEGGEKDQEGRTLVLDSFWPFWMDKSSPDTVENSLSMSKLVLLTGPNMAGKSTVIRSVCSASLLANCGLHAPCAPTSRVPYFDAYILRSAESADNPADGLSTFAVEMSDARAIVRDASADSLVFVDELCKGTEAKAGACIAAATLERLASHNGCLGLFATHLHDILELPIERSALELMRMETEPGDGEGGKWRRRATWKIGHGVCTESLAFQVAEKYGVPDEIVQRAYALSLGLEQANARSTEIEAAKINGAAGGQEEVVEPSEEEEQEQVLSFDRGVQVLAGLASEALGEDAEAIRLQRGAHPPPSAIGYSCVYVYRLSDDTYYVGETDNIAQRFSAHQSTRKSGLTDFAFVKLPKGGKSVGRLVETQAIHRMAGMGFDLISEADGMHSNFGVR